MASRIMIRLKRTLQALHAGDQAVRMTSWSKALVALLSTLLIGSLASQVIAQGARPLPMQQGHRLYNPSMPPGNIYYPPGPVNHTPEYFQPVAFSGPDKVQFSMPTGDGFQESQPELMVGLNVGRVYRFRVTNIPFHPGAELYPTVELLGRTFPPAGAELRHPIPLNLSETDLANALGGLMVTRVVYLEDPQSAFPLAVERKDATPIDVPTGQDLLATADTYGRPIAVIRIGSLAPPTSPVLMGQFYFGYPNWIPLQAPATGAAGAEPEPVSASNTLPHRVGDLPTAVQVGYTAPVTSRRSPTVVQPAASEPLYRLADQK